MRSVALGDVAEFINGAAFKPADWGEDGSRIIRIQNLNDPSKPYNRTTRQVPKKYEVPSGTLLVSWSASLGVTPQDLTELERIMIEEAGASNDDLENLRAKGGLGLFVRSLVGLERDAAKAAFADFLAGKNMNGNQIEFINLIVDHLTESGAMDPRRLYESPFTDFDDQGVSGVFLQADVQHIVQVLNNVRERAAA